MKEQKTFGEMLHHFRRESSDQDRGGALTQERIAELVNLKTDIPCSRNSIGDWEKNKKKIRIDERALLIGLIATLIDCGGITSLDEVNLLLEKGDYRSLNENETNSLFHLPPISFLGEKDNQNKFTHLSNKYRKQFQLLIDEKTKEFVGRSYLFEQVKYFINTSTNGYITIVGDPGTGKSAFIAAYVQQENAIAHFNIRAQGITSSAQFYESLYEQLNERYKLNEEKFSADLFQNGTYFGYILDEASARLRDKEKLVIVVDALDEVDQTDISHGRNVLSLPAHLPENVYFILTRRRVKLPLVISTPHLTIDMLEHHQENVDDVHAYLSKVVNSSSVYSWVKKHSLTKQQMIEKLAQKTDENFMYLRYIIHEIKQGIYQDADLKDLPNGLQGYYEDHWRIMGMRSKTLPRKKLKVIYFLCEVRQPVSRTLLSEFTKENEIDVQIILDEWIQFLHPYQHDGHIRYSLYHDSFRDFLHQKEVVQAAELSIKEINAEISENLWQDFYGEKGD